jgi:hypothetical protein
MFESINKDTLDGLVKQGQIKSWRLEPGDPGKYQTDELFITFPNGYILAIGCQATGYGDSGACLVVE